MFPEHQNLLPAYRDPGPLKGKAMVRKPMLGREGNNIEISDGGKILAETSGTYTETGYIYQAYAEPVSFAGNHANLGVWMVHDTACGMGVREDAGLIISNRSRFVPHIFD
jgi:glutathionylspermidine synthase